MDRTEAASHDEDMADAVPVIPNRVAVSTWRPMGAHSLPQGVWEHIASLPADSLGSCLDGVEMYGSGIYRAQLLTPDGFQVGPSQYLASGPTFASVPEAVEALKGQFPGVDARALFERTHAFVPQTNPESEVQVAQAVSDKRLAAVARELGWKEPKDTPPDLAALAAEFLDAHDTARGPVPDWVRVMNVAGEAGEMAEAYRRLTGHARRTGTVEELSAEMADVVMTTYMAAHQLGIDLDAAISDKHAVVMTRGFGGES